jgi:mono/diheme cytochrome c family protein
MIILITSNKEDSRIRNLMAAFVDRQAVFKGDCAKCHVVPVLGKLGKDLFDSACVICHQSEQRATMVTDLRAKSLDRSREYWRTWIEDGQDGTLMPAFSQSKGGPLTASQIESLADYLGETFVRKGQKGEKGLEPGL